MLGHTKDLLTTVNLQLSVYIPQLDTAIVFHYVIEDPELLQTHPSCVIAWLNYTML